MAVTLRPVRENDENFLLELYASTRAEELAITPWSPDQKQEFLRMQFDAQTRYYRQAFPEMDYRIVIHDGVPAGRFIVLRREDELRLLDISLLRSIAMQASATCSSRCCSTRQRVLTRQCGYTSSALIVLS